MRSFVSFVACVLSLNLFYSIFM